MPYVLIRDFSGGLDLRKSPVSAEAGTLRVLRNAYINAGGEIEKRKAFVKVATLPAGTYGLGPNVSSNTLATFGPGPQPAGMPSFISYQQLVGGNPWSAVRDVEMFDGKIYVIVEQTADGNSQHFYDGQLVNLGLAGYVFDVRAHRSKMYGVSGKFLLFSGLNNAANWTTATGSGAVQVDTRDTGEWALVGVEAYYDQLALFGTNGIQLWNMDEDPLQNSIVSSLAGTGVAGPQALCRYASGDILFVHDSGIRSLRARDSSNNASVSDIGAPIDELIRPRLQYHRVVDPLGLFRYVMGRVEPVSGQVWFFWRDMIYVLSMVPSTKIVAWSVFEPGFNIDHVAVVGPRLYLRSGNDVYLYGGQDFATYDGCEVEAVIPMLDAGTPATDKTWTGLDIMAEGTWTVEAGADSTAFDVRDLVATVTGPSFELQKIGMQLFGTHLSARFRTTSASRARLGSALFHHTGKGDKG